MAKGVGVAISKLGGHLLDGHIFVKQKGLAPVDAQTDEILRKGATKGFAKLLAQALVAHAATGGDVLKGDAHAVILLQNIKDLLHTVLGRRCIAAGIEVAEQPLKFHKELRRAVVVDAGKKSVILGQPCEDLHALSRIKNRLVGGKAHIHQHIKHACTRAKVKFQPFRRGIDEGVVPHPGHSL